MYNIREGLQQVLGKVPPRYQNDYILCGETDAVSSLSTNRLRDSVACFGYTLVVRGHITVRYNGADLTMKQNDIFIYSPGMSFFVAEVSDDYQGLLLLADINTTVESLTVRNALRAAFFPVVERVAPKQHLSEADAAQLATIMRMAAHYCTSEHPFRSEALKTMYNLFLLEMIAMQERTVPQHRFPKRVEEVFLAFVHLMSVHFEAHHDIGFYAEHLCITPQYLSRIVSQVTGKTVRENIDGMLIVEASWLLQTTDLGVGEIAERLHFAETSTFVRFFQRHKGLSPKNYRKQFN